MNSVHKPFWCFPHFVIFLSWTDWTKVIKYSRSLKRLLSLLLIKKIYWTNFHGVFLKFQKYPYSQQFPFRTDTLASYHIYSSYSPSPVLQPNSLPLWIRPQNPHFHSSSNSTSPVMFHLGFTSHRSGSLGGRRFLLPYVFSTWYTFGMI